MILTKRALHDPRSDCSRPNDRVGSCSSATSEQGDIRKEITDATASLWMFVPEPDDGLNHDLILRTPASLRQRREDLEHHIVYALGCPPELLRPFWEAEHRALAQALQTARHRAAQHGRTLSISCEWDAESTLLSDRIEGRGPLFEPELSP